MKKFIAKEDVRIFGFPIANKGEILIIEDYLKINKYNNNFSIPVSEFINDERFEEVKEELDIEIREITEEEDMTEKKYRIQLDVFTNKKKLIELENFLRKSIQDFL